MNFILKEKKDLVKFSEVSLGVVFLWDGALYMKIRVTPPYSNAVSFGGNCLAFFEGHRLVKPVEGSFIES